MPPAPSAKVLVAEQGGSGKQHFSIDVAFPVYAIAFTDNRTVVLGGGGGSSRTGVKNRLSTYTIDDAKRQFDLVQEHELSKAEDAPMSIAVNPSSKHLVAGINSSAAQLKEGVNENLRIFSYDKEGVTFESSKQTINSTDEDHYQKITCFNRSSPALIAIGSTNSQLSVLTFPALEDQYPPITYDGDEIYDTDFDDSGEMVMGTSSNKLCIWSTKPVPKGDIQEPIQIIQRPVLKKELTCTFRAAKFGRKDTKTNIYTVVNASPAVRSRKAGKGEKKSFVSMWDTRTWKLIKTKTVSQKPVTAFDVSIDGTLLAYGSSDLSVGVLDAATLASIMTILRAHEFPVTSLRFNPSADLVVSGSADNTVRVIAIPPASARGGSNTLWNILLTLLVLLLAILIQRSLAPSLSTVIRSSLSL